MHFSDYLFFTKRLTWLEYIQLTLYQNPNVHFSYDPANPGGTCNFDLRDIPKLRRAAPEFNYHRIPFGDVLRADSNVLPRLKANEPDLVAGVAAITPRLAPSEFDDKFIELLLKEWREWHVQMLETICNYSLSTKIGRELYKKRLEKQLAARYVANKLINNGDTVCIPEGSSGTYVGLAIGGLKTRVRIVTSNDPLIREYRENPSFANNLSEMQAIGGHVDDLLAHGGVSGNDCEEQYEKAIAVKPKASVLIMAVTGLIPKEGPYGLDQATCSLKRKLIKFSLQQDVRSLVFVTDWTKHLPSRMAKGEYGVPIFNIPNEWHKILEEHKQRIWIITVPPPTLRELITINRFGTPLARKSINRPLDINDSIDAPFLARLESVETEYDQVSRELAFSLHINPSATHPSNFDSTFVEVCVPTESF